MASRRGRLRMKPMISATSSGGDLGLVVELLDALSGAGVGDVARQLGRHDTRLDERHPDLGQQFLPE